MDLWNIPPELTEYILAFFGVREIISSRIVSESWNETLTTYLKTSPRGRRISPVIRLSCEDQFEQFASIFKQTSLDLNFPYFKYRLNVFYCSASVIKTFGIRCGKLVSECTFEMHPPGHYNIHCQFHPSRPSMASCSSRLEYAAFTKISTLLRTCTNLQRLTISNGSPNFYEFYEIFVQLPKCLPELTSLVIQNFEIPRECWPYRCPMDRVNMALDQNKRPRFLRGTDLVCSLVRRASNLKVLRWINHGGEHRVRDMNLSRLLSVCRTVPLLQISIEENPEIYARASVVLPSLENICHIKALSFRLIHRPNLPDCGLIQRLSQQMPSLSQSLERMTIKIDCSYCCNLEGSLLSSFKQLKWLSLSYYDRKEAMNFPILFSGQFPKLGKLQLDIRCKTSPFGKGYSCPTLSDLQLRCFPSMEGVRWDILFPNLKSLDVSQNHKACQSLTYVKIVPKLSILEHLEFFSSEFDWETLTGEPSAVEPSDESLLNLSSAKLQSGGVEFGCCKLVEQKKLLLRTALKSLKTLTVIMERTDLLTLKAFLYMCHNDAFNLEMKITFIICLPADSADVEERVINYANILRILRPEFRCSFVTFDEEYQAQDVPLDRPIFAPRWGREILPENLTIIKNG